MSLRSTTAFYEMCLSHAALESEPQFPRTAIRLTFVIGLGPLLIADVSATPRPSLDALCLGIPRWIETKVALAWVFPPPYMRSGRRSLLRVCSLAMGLIGSPLVRMDVGHVVEPHAAPMNSSLSSPGHATCRRKGGPSAHLSSNFTGLSQLEAGHECRRNESYETPH